MAVIALDLGGTKLAGAIFERDAAMPVKRVLPLEGRGGTAVGQLMREMVLELLSARPKRVNIRGVGISVPGIAYRRTGRVWAPNIPGWHNYPLRGEIASVLRRSGVAACTVEIDNDRACSILGESWKGVAQGCGNAIFLAVGTGIGAGVLVDGMVLRGAKDIAGSIGWLALDRPFRPAYVGCGCFEYHASGDGLAKVGRKLAGRASFARKRASNAHDLFRSYGNGNPLARKVISQAVEFWGMAVANLVSLFNPDMIVFGGGVFGPAKQFLPQIRAEAKKWAQPIAMKQVKLCASKLGPDAALYGAARLAFGLQEARPGS